MFQFVVMICIAAGQPYATGCHQFVAQAHNCADAHLAAADKAKLWVADRATDPKFINSEVTLHRACRQIG